MLYRGRRRPIGLLIAAGVLLLGGLPGQPQRIGPGSVAVGATPTAIPTGVGGPAPHTLYVAVGGSDANSGLTLATAYRTISRCAQQAQPGDTCYIAAGTYNETVTPPRDGGSGNPISFRPFGTDTVTVSGADPVSAGAWTAPTSGSIWTASLAMAYPPYSTSCTTNTTLCANQVFVDGQMLPEARWPNPGATPMTPTVAWTTNGTTQKTGQEGTIVVNRDSHVASSTMPGADNNGWAGANVKLSPGGGFYGETGTVVTSTTGSLSAVGLNYRCIAPADAQCPNTANQFYVTGLPVFLSSAGMWVYTPAAAQLSVWFADSGGPSGHTVQVKTRNYAFDLAGRSYIMVAGLSLFADTVRTTANSTNDVLDGLTVTYPSHYVTVPNNAYGATTTTGQGGVSPQTYGLDSTGVIISGTNNTIQNSTISLSAGNGIALLGAFNSATNNLIHDVDYAGGYGAGIAMVGHDLVVSHNTIYNTGRDGIEMGSSRLQGFNYHCNCAPNFPQFYRNTITYNDVWHSMVLNADGGEIYQCCELDNLGSVIAYNFAHDQQAALPSSPAPGSAIGGGIYIDNASFNSIVHHNVTWGNTATYTPAPPGGHATVNAFGWVWNQAAGYPNGGWNNTLGGLDVFYTTLGLQAQSGITNTIFGAGVVNAGGPNWPLFDHDITSTVSAVSYVDAAHNNYQLAAGDTVARDQGVVAAPYTNGYTGAAPDLGAFEFGAAPWRPGCSMPACADPNTTMPTASSP